LHLGELNIGESALILSYTDLEMSLKFLEMGCVPGEIVRMERIAPLGDPLAIRVSGYLLSMRKSEAATILIELQKEGSIERW
jgi:ferrous iron transport protein A